MSVDNASPADALVNAARELSERVGRFLLLIRSLVSTTLSIMPGRRTSPIFVIVPPVRLGSFFSA